LILVTGGAGYIGSVLVRQLLNAGYRVRVLDNLMFGGESILDLLDNPKFEFILGDVRNRKDLDQASKGVFAVAHLAAIVGDPACSASPELAIEVNRNGSKMLFESAVKNGVRRFVFASTCSNYGKMDDSGSYVDENSPLAPVSLYAEEKVSFEKYLLEQKSQNVTVPVCLRFSTVYGLSQRPRFDLTVNEFTKELALGRELLVYGQQFWRPYCHVADLARSVLAVIETDESKMAFEVFNVGSTKENYTKEMIVNEIRKQLPDSRIKYVKKKEDPRDYRVNFEKINKELDFDITVTVPEGIRNLVTAIRSGMFIDVDDKKYKNI